jgi:hypothetical protein
MANQEILCILWSPNVHNCISKSLSQDCHVKLDHCHHSMAYPQSADRADSQKKARELGRGLIPPHHGTQICQTLQNVAQR